MVQSFVLNFCFLDELLVGRLRDAEPLEPVPSEQPVFAGDQTSDVDPSVTKEEIRDALLDHCKNGGVVPELSDKEVEARIANIREKFPEPQTDAPKDHECDCHHKKCSCGHKHKHRDPFMKGPKFSSTSPASKKQKAQKKARKRNRRK